MKYKDPITGEFKPISVKVSDTLPVGSVVDFDGTTVPDGWEEVEDNIIESGSNDNGSYIKFTDGTLITSHQVTRTLARTAEWGSMFETTEAANLGDYPIPFKYTPFVHVTLYSTNAICEAVQQATATSAGKMYVLGPTSNNSANYTFQILAIGRWK